MYKIDIETSQNITLSFPAASVVERIGAYVIDFIIQILYFIIISSILDGVIKNIFDNEGYDNYNSLMMVFYLPILFYHLIFEYFNNGQSIGKKIMKIKVAHLDGTRPELGSLFTRWIIGLLEFYMFMGAPAMLSIMFGNTKSQRLGDIAANTTVIKMKEPTLLQSASDKFDFALDYEPVFAKAILLNDQQIDLINKVLHQNSLRLRNQQINKLADKIEAEYNIKQNDMSKGNYLRQIVKDYAFMNWVEENKGQIDDLKYGEYRFG